MSSSSSDGDVDFLVQNGPCSEEVFDSADNDSAILPDLEIGQFVVVKVYPLNATFRYFIALV